MDDVVLNKAATIERCISRAREEYASNPDRLYKNQTTQDAIVLNLQRACEASIDLAMHLVRIEHLGIPQTTREAFVLLEKSSAIEAELALRLRRMVGFRNVAVHDYQALNLDIVRALVETGVNDLALFARIALSRMNPSEAP